MKTILNKIAISVFIFLSFSNFSPNNFIYIYSQNTPQITSYTLLEPLSTTSKTVSLTESGTSEYFNSVFIYSLIIMSMISVFFLMYYGLVYLTTDIVNRKLEGREGVLKVITGLVFVFCAWILLNSINPDLLKNGLNFGGGGGIINGNGSGGGVGSPNNPTSPNKDTSVPINPTGNYPWPTGRVQGANNVTCNGGGITRGYSKSSACMDNYKDAINTAAANHGVDKNVIRAIIYQESAGNPNIGSSNMGAVGMMQIKPETANAIGCKSGWQNNPAKNIDCGARYLKQGNSSNKVSNKYDLYAGYNGGYGQNALDSSTNCSGLKRWQCAFDNNDHTQCNTGFLESRNYAIMVDTWTKENSKNCSW